VERLEERDARIEKLESELNRKEPGVEPADEAARAAASKPGPDASEASADEKQTAGDDSSQEASDGKSAEEPEKMVR
jgi:hypothetical protein